MRVFEGRNPRRPLWYPGADAVAIIGHLDAARPIFFLLLLHPMPKLEARMGSVWLARPVNCCL